ncbi:TIGR02680 family protein [Sphaerisporangium aureirubrum]|uniref:TIGR02680 family protein n=1 Tax=Sphaerisporangium aureirubrum TaxID=1544736 RepID=A0ABW1NBM3_9ACTN
MTLPAPCSERWKPLRAGLVDMFYYDVEEFHFHDGRLLLRGNNGTGKSKVLALTLPFLLDGELAPHRVEPDGDRQKKMEWNLLLGGRHPHHERLGYTWMEFGRRAADGTTEFRTIGCGLKAVKDRGIARHWFFVTPQRVGGDLSLLSATRVALTREKLRDAVEGHGMVYDRASDYRRAVDEALFGLGEHRYEALVNLLIQLRQPQLSKRPDEKLLSRALTEALPPLSPELITTVAESFRGLDEERGALRALEDARTAAAHFLSHYRGYAAMAAKRKASAPRVTHSRYEHLGRDLIEADGRYTAARTGLDAAQATLESLEAERVRLEARREALRQSPEMRDAQRLKESREEAGRQAETARIRERDRERLGAEVARRQRRADEHRLGVERAAVTLRVARDEAGAAARCARCEDAHLAAAGRWAHDLAGQVTRGEAEEDLTRARRDTGTLAERRGHAVSELERLLGLVGRAELRLGTARDEVDRLTGELQSAAERIATAERGTADQAAELMNAYLSYLTGTVELRVAGMDDVAAALETWARQPEGRNPAMAAVDDAARSATTELARRLAGLEVEARSGRETAGELEEEIRRLEAGGHDAPPVPHTRAAGARDGRPGAPFWKVVDFIGEVHAEHRAGLEAALEAAGILDAWVTPDGTLLAADDTVLLTAAPVPGLTAADALRPAVDRADPRADALPDAAVRAVLDSIGLGPGAATWVAVDGRWANGVLGGSWHKVSADHIGEGAREAARRARLVRLGAELATVRVRLEELRAAGEELAARQRTLAAEHRSAPPDAALREAHVKLAGEHARRVELNTTHQAATVIMTNRQGEVSAARAQASEFAADVGLPVETAELAAVSGAVSGYRLALAELWPAAQALLVARATADDAEQELADTRERLTEAGGQAAQALERAEAAAETYRALMETAGAAVDELHRKLDEVGHALGAREMEERRNRARERDALQELGNAEGTRERLSAEIGEAEKARDVAVAEFQAFAATGVLRVALPELDIPDAAQPWAVTPAVILARAVNAALESVDDADGRWDRVQKRVTEEHKLLSDALARHGHSVGLTMRDGVMVVDVVFQGRARDVPELAEALAAETAHRKELLSAREREILENHLLNEVAGTLHELIAAAEEEVAAMNAELESRPTSTGMRLRLVWQTARNAPEGLARVREKLRQTVDAWSDADRGAVGAFLQEQIDREHTENAAAGWTEQLTRALDYRSWHEFTIKRLQDGQWRPATGPASGGERVLAASVPLFAAASAHYKSAGNPHAPRLVALDEAFAGVDDDSRAKCLGLLATFDMDVVMTSEREWGCYPEVPGLSICQLSRRDGVDAVLVTPWRWDGHERRRAGRADVAAPSAVASPEPDQEGLFG